MMIFPLPIIIPQLLPNYNQQPSTPSINAVNILIVPREWHIPMRKEKRTVRLMNGKTMTYTIARYKLR